VPDEVWRWVVWRRGVVVAGCFETVFGGVAGAWTTGVAFEVGGADATGVALGVLFFAGFLAVLVFFAGAGVVVVGVGIDLVTGVATWSVSEELSKAPAAYAAIAPPASRRIRKAAARPLDE
jgi:hypothetical protein